MPGAQYRGAGQRDEVLRLEVMYVLLAAGARERGELHVERLEIVAHVPCADLGFCAKEDHLGLNRPGGFCGWLKRR